MAVGQERFVELYEQLYPRVLAFALHRVAPDEARDAVDEAFLVGWHKRDEVPAEGMLPWLLVVVRNILANRYRRRHRQDVVLAEVTRLAGGASEASADVAVVERMTVLSALAQLTERDREALILTAWDGLAAGDAARVAGCSSVAFAVRLHRARHKFTAALARLDARSPHEEPIESRTLTVEGNTVR